MSHSCLVSPSCLIRVSFVSLSLSGANWQNPVLAGIVLDATNNSAYNFAMNDVVVTVDCYRGYGITSGDNSKVATTPIDR